VTQHPGPAGGLQGPALREVLAELCERRQYLLLATPYFSFESRFLDLSGDALLVRATMSRNAARHALNHPALRLRFPWELTFYGGPTRILAYEEEGSKRRLRVSLPASFTRDDQRRAYRVEQVGRSMGALGGQDLSLVRCAVENVSMGGVRVFCTEPLPSTGFQPGCRVDLSLSLDKGPSLTAGARICHSSGQSLGLAFHPPLEGPQREALEAWITPLIREARRLWDNRAEIRAQAERAVRPRVPPGGVVLVSADPQLRSQVEAAMPEGETLRAVPPVLAPFKEAMEAQLPYVLLVSPTGGLDESHRLRSLLEAVPHPCPLVVVGNGPDLDQLRALALLLKATLFVDSKSTGSVFFQRLIQGLIRKHWNPLGPV
jgi:hypothetical protein